MTEKCRKHCTTVLRRLTEVQRLPVLPAPTDAAAQTAAFLSASLCLGIVMVNPVHALELRLEPSNALSLPTWAIHISSVIEWVTAMGLIWKYADVTGNLRWRGMSWAMLPCLGSALCACTWHFFYNSPDLEFLVALQAFLTLVGNCACFWAAYQLYLGSTNETV